MSAQKVDAAIRARIHALLDDAFGDRLQGVVLYGSEARGTADSDSDADLLVLLRGPMALGKDLKTIIDARVLALPECPQGRRPPVNPEAADLRQRAA